jgi:hypothetical protein
MLATIENHTSINAGITANLERFLPNGPVLEGQMQLCFAKVHNAMAKLDVELFIEGMKDSVSYYSYSKVNGRLNAENITYGVFPVPNKEQKESLKNITELYALLYLAMYILKEETISTDKVINKISVLTNYGIRQILIDRLKFKGPDEDFETDFAQLLLAHNTSLSDSSMVSPKQVFGLAFKVLQIADKTGNYRLFSKTLLPWLELKWKFIWQKQRFLLKNTTLNEHLIEAALNKKNVPAHIKVTKILSTILPTLEISNSDKLIKILDTLSKKY